MKSIPLKVLVIRFSAWGDVILTLDAMRQLIAQPGNEVHVLTKSTFASVYKDEVGLRVHELSNGASLRELFSTLHILKTEKYDYVVDLHSNLRSRLACAYLWRITLRIQKPRVREFILFLFRKWGRGVVSGHSFHRGHAALALVSPGAMPVRRGVPQSSRVQNWVAFCSDTAWASKQWPEERFLAAARQLKAAHPTVKVLWLGLNCSLPLNADVCDEDCRGVTALPRLKELLGRCTALLCNDTGMMHLAEDLGVPVAAIFGPTTRELGFGPRLKLSKIIERPLWCRPCSKNGSKCHRLGEAKQSCLKAVTVEDVLNVLTGMLTKSSSHDTLNLP